MIWCTGPLSEISMFILETWPAAFSQGIMSILTANMREDDCNIIIILSLGDVTFSPPTFNYTPRLMERGGHFTPLT